MVRACVPSSRSANCDIFRLFSGFRDINSTASNRRIREASSVGHLGWSASNGVRTFGSGSVSFCSRSANVRLVFDKIRCVNLNTPTPGFPCPKSNYSATLIRKQVRFGLYFIGTHLDFIYWSTVEKLADLLFYASRVSNFIVSQVFGIWTFIWRNSSDLEFLV